MKHKILFILIAVLIPTALIIGYNYYLASQNQQQQIKPAQTATTEVAPAPPPTSEELLRLVNEERAKVGVRPLVVDPVLQQSAQWKAEDMATRKYNAHEDPVTGKRNGLDYLMAHGGDDLCSYIGENLYWARNNLSSAQDSLNWWLNSPAHKEAMLDKRYTKTGFGIAGNKVVQHFCIVM